MAWIYLPATCRSLLGLKDSDFEFWLRRWLLFP